MSTIIMMFILPLGILVYLFEKRTHKKNLEMFESYIQKVKNSELPDEEKLNKIDHMYYNNGYKCKRLEEGVLLVEKKHFNLGVAFIFFGLFNYFGIAFYLIYYRFILKPESIKIEI